MSHLAIADETPPSLLAHVLRALLVVGPLHLVAGDGTVEVTMLGDEPSTGAGSEEPTIPVREHAAAPGPAPAPRPSAKEAAERSAPGRAVAPRRTIVDMVLAALSASPKPMDSTAVADAMGEPYRPRQIRPHLTNLAKQGRIVRTGTETYTMPGRQTGAGIDLAGIPISRPTFDADKARNGAADGLG